MALNHIEDIVLAEFISQLSEDLLVVALKSSFSFRMLLEN